MDETDPKCAICGEPAAATCEKCGLAYCLHHRGDEPAAGDRPVCWNCRATGDAKAVLFWVMLGAVGLGVLIAFLSRWM